MNLEVTKDRLKEEQQDERTRIHEVLLSGTGQLAWRPSGREASGSLWVSGLSGRLAR